MTRSEGKANLALLHGAAQLNEVVCKDNLSLYYAETIEKLRLLEEKQSLEVGHL